MSNITRDISIVKDGKSTTIPVTLSEDEWERTTDTALQALHGDPVAPKAAAKPAAKPKPAGAASGN